MRTFSAGETEVGELVKGISFFPFFENTQLTDSSSDKNPWLSGTDMPQKEKLCVRPGLPHKHVPDFYSLVNLQNDLLINKVSKETKTHKGQVIS